MVYVVQFKPAALKELEKLPRKVQKRIAIKIDGLQGDPFPLGCKKLIGVPNAWRLRTGDYRLIYQVNREALLILVLTIAHRREVYR